MKYISILITAALFSTNAFAWGRHGHHAIGDAAAALAADDTKTEGLKYHSYDLGYYANVPDFIWKRPATYNFEKYQHFMDLEIYERAFSKKEGLDEALKLSRKEFDAKFPEVPQDAGRSFFRIREMVGQLEKISEDLRKLPEQKGKARQALQEKWVLTAGLLGHYVGDLGMPLHVSENYDGQLTGQKGIHGFFEDICVDEVYPGVAVKAKALVSSHWRAYKKANADKPLLTLLKDLTADSQKAVKPLLAIDKASKRADVKVTCPKFESLIAQRWAKSILVLAEIYRRNLGWTFDNDKFYYWNGEPQYIQPDFSPEVAASLNPKK